jgi:metal-responsive CopG/Arc/MetJ family transcriptional regulator
MISIMRTIIEIPKELAKSLDLYRKSKGISRTEAIRRAIQQYLERLAEPASDEAFGLWKGKVDDGLRYERTVRGEWGDSE